MAKVGFFILTKEGELFGVENTGPDKKKESEELTPFDSGFDINDVSEWPEKGIKWIDRETGEELK